MAIRYKKGSPKKLSESFTSTDFDCKCTRENCTDTLISDSLVTALEVLRKISGPFEINSGFRCNAHNIAVGGAPNSQHCLGQAADCKSKTGLNGRIMAQDAECVDAFNFGGIGTAFDWVHLDVRGYKARWKY